MPISKESMAGRQEKKVFGIIPTMIKQKIGRYEINAELGQGAMGVVYRATDPLLERTVAIKTINLDMSGDELADFERRFYREARLAGCLNHPNIVTIHDVGNSGKIAYMAMEFLEGEELRDILGSGERLPIERIAKITADIADGLAFAHEHGVVHRDIKPSNIMVLKNGAVKITDFGIALIPSSSRTMVGMVLGSPKYMSPEQVVGQEVDGRSDIFSLGVVLYEMLTGKPAFGGENINTIMYRILNEIPISPGKFRPGLPAALDYIVARALAKHPDERYQSAAHMADDLRGYQSLTVPENFGAAPGIPPHTLERRATPRDFDEQTTVLAPRTPPAAPPGKHRSWLMLTASGLALALVGAWLLTRAPAPATVAEAPAPALPPPATPPAQQAKLAFAVTPWGEVFVDGTSKGVSPPLQELELAAGEHAVEIRNGDSAPYVATIKLDGGTTTKIKHKFN